MGDLILIYDNGNQYYIDSSELYDPFPEESSDEEEDESQDLQTV